MYLWRKRNSYLFQIRVPAHLVEAFGSSHFRLSLGQISGRDAKERSLRMAATAFEGFRAGMDRETLSASLKALSEEISYLRKAEFRANFGYVDRIRRLEDEHNDYGIEPDPAVLADLKQKRAVRLARVDALNEARTRLAAIGDALNTDAAALRAERAAYEHAFTTLASVKTPSEVNEPIEVQRSEHEDERTVTAETTLSVAGGIYLELRRATKEGARGDDRYQERLENALAAFIDVVGDKPLKFYLPIHVQDFATVLAKVPTNRSKHACFRGLSLREMAEANLKRKVPMTTLNESTISGMISEVLNLWSKATAGVEGVRDLKSLKITMPSSARKKNVRAALATGSLDIWMRDAAAINTVRQDYKRFLPLLGLLTGMRLGEMTWLQPKDITEIDGHMVIDLRLPLMIGGKEVERALKTETSPRIVALHPFLTQCGFIRWAKSRKTWIFSEFHDAKDPSDAAGKQMGHWMRKLGIHVEHKQVFHSLRHNTKHWIRVSLDKFIADRQCGHAPVSIGDTYGFPVLQADEIEKIEALPLPKGVDFSGFLRKLSSER